MNTESKNNKRHAARERLKQLTETVKPLVEAGEFSSINEALISSYRTKEHNVFKTFRGWKKESKIVRKTERGFLLWSHPKKILKKEQDGTELNYEFYPVSYVFSNAQVIPMEKDKGTQNNEETTAEELREARKRRTEKNPGMER